MGLYSMHYLVPNYLHKKFYEVSFCPKATPEKVQQSARYAVASAMSLTK